MIDRQKQFEAALNEFPEPVRKILQTIPRQTGRLSATQCTELMKRLGIDPEELMIRLLSLAKIYAVVPVSRFQVGAVAMAVSRRHADRFEIFMGANMEFMHQPLNQSVHAEQSAALHAWHQGARHLKAIAASEALCGHCRQFLYELENNADMMVIAPNAKKPIYRRTALSDLLPEAFGPLALGNPETGEIFSGRYAESAAYNPSVSPLQSTALCMNMASLKQQRSIRRAVLVEKPTAISQRNAAELLLESWAPGVELEYYEIN
jgi:cytidine deaminase